MPKLKLGAAVYALIALASLAAAWTALRGHGSYAGADRPFLISMAIVFLLTGVLFGIGAVTRRGLLADDGPWICRTGWILVAGLMVASCALSFLFDTGDSSPMPPFVVAFVPAWIKRLQEKYYEGVAEAERELSAAGPGEGTRSGS
ncbi:hypothetical protein ACXJJ3_15340 [Kribbella sp. WER1]